VLDGWGVAAQGDRWQGEGLRRGWWVQWTVDSGQWTGLSARRC
jgi:hypothetical protein